MQEVSSKTLTAHGEKSCSDLAMWYRIYMDGGYFFAESWAKDHCITEEDAETMLVLCKACHEAGF